MVTIKSCRYTLLTIRLPMTWLQHVQMKQLTILVKLGVRLPIVIVMCLMEYWVNHQKWILEFYWINEHFCNKYFMLFEGNFKFDHNETIPIGCLVKRWLFYCDTKALPNGMMTLRSKHVDFISPKHRLRFEVSSCNRFQTMSNSILKIVPKIAIFACRTQLWRAIATHHARLQKETFFIYTVSCQYNDFVWRNCISKFYLRYSISSHFLTLPFMANIDWYSTQWSS